MTGTVQGSLEAEVYFGPNPLALKLLLREAAAKGSVDLETAWKPLNSELGINDSERTYTKSYLDWNKTIFEEKTSNSNKREWQLTPAGKEITQHLSSGKDLNPVDKAFLGRAYLRDPIAKTVYGIYAGKNITRQEGVKLLASQAQLLEITPGQAEWFANEKTSALVALGLLSRTKKGKETVYA
jgi:hypothetical protein